MFARNGYGGATMDDIAAEMGCSKGILYYQFQSKQDLIVETRRVASGGAATRLEVIAKRPIPVRERVEMAIRDLSATSFDEFSRHVILTPTTIGLDEAHAAQVRSIERDYEKLLIGLLEQGMTEGVFVRRNAKATAFTVIQTCLSLAIWYREGGGVTREEAMDVVADMLMRGL